MQRFMRIDYFPGDQVCVYGLCFQIEEEIHADYSGSRTVVRIPNVAENTPVLKREAYFFNDDDTSYLRRYEVATILARHLFEQHWEINGDKASISGLEFPGELIKA